MASEAHLLKSDRPLVLVVMGVSGVGKTTIALELAARLGWPYEEGDALHPQANVDKMRAGNPLSDADRAPWLAAIASWIDSRLASGEPGIITCSAFKRSYREQIIGDRAGVRLVYLRGSSETISQRLAGRQGHFMPWSLLQSQLDTLEEPSAEERSIVVDVDGSAEAIAGEIASRLSC